MKKQVNRKPRVSVLMTAYNAELFVAEAIESILNQTYRDLELVVVDANSTDSTLQIVRAIAKRDRSVKVIAKRKNEGPSVASNLGLRYVRGQYVARMDADDVAFPDRIAKQLAYLESHPDVVAVGAQCELIDRQGRPIGIKSFPLLPEKIYAALVMYNPLQHPSIMINRQLLGKHTLHYSNRSVLAHDLELLFGLVRYGKLANLPDTLLRYRYHSDSLSLHNPRETFSHTTDVRDRARDTYGYEATVGGKAIDRLQRILMAVLPNVLVYPIFRIMRMNSMEELGEVMNDVGLYLGSRLRLKATSAASAVAGIIARYYT